MTDQDLAAQRIVIVGAGLGGHIAARTLRQEGFAGRITVLDASQDVGYDRPPLSKELFQRIEPVPLAEEVGVDLAATVDAVVLGAAATGLVVRDGGGFEVHTSAETFLADAVIIATGSAPLTPSWAHGSSTLHSLTDARLLREAVPPSGRLLVVGAGWIGTEVAATASAYGVEVELFEAGRAPLASVLPADVGELTRPWFEAAGVTMHLDSGVVHADAQTIHLSDGVAHAADAVLVAVGMRPATGWLHGGVNRHGLHLDEHGFIPVDGWGRPLMVEVHGSSSEAAAFGALRVVGDPVVRDSERHGRVRGGHWTGTISGAQIAAESLLAELRDETVTGADPVEPDPAPYVFSKQFGHDLVVVGHPDRHDDVLVLGEAGGPQTAVTLRPSSTVVTAVVCIDSPRDIGYARRLFSHGQLPTLTANPVPSSDAVLPQASLRDIVTTVA